MIVIVEDDEMSARLLLKIIAEFFPASQCRHLKTVAETLDFIAKEKPGEDDVFVIDLYLSDGNAVDVIDKLDSVGFLGRIALTPGLPLTDEEKKILHGRRIDKILLKPLTASVLAPVLNPG